MTLRDIARKAGFSHVTVSRALRNDPAVSPELRATIKKLAESMGYTPDPVLTALLTYRFGRQSKKIHSALAWINRYPDPKHFYKFAELNAYWTGAKKAAERFGYHLEEIRWEPDEPCKRLETILSARGIRGLVLPPHHITLNWEGFNWANFSAVRFGMSNRNPDVHAVTSDQLRAVVMAMGKIRSYGYERIGLVVPKSFDRYLGGNYVGGFFAAHELFDLGELVPPLLTERDIYVNEKSRARAELEEWLEKYKPDAALVTGIEVIKMLNEIGLRVPKDIALAGSSVLDLPLDAGINQNSENIGRIAVETLVSQINLNERGQPAAPCRILVESLWQDGKSLPSRNR